MAKPFMLFYGRPNSLAAWGRDFSLPIMKGK